MIIIIGILVALTLPAINRTKHPARKLACLNNMRNVGLGIVNFSAGANSELPLLVDPNIVTDPDGTNANAHWDDLSWCTKIIPFLDHVEFRQKWDMTASAASVKGADPSALIALNKNRFPVFSCPDDQFNTDPGALSYVVNVGYVTSNYNASGDSTHHPASIDGGLDGDCSTTADIPVKFASGVFWRSHEARMSLDYISEGDGLTQTLMLSENLQADAWSDQDTGSLGFGIDMQGVYSSGTATLVLPAGFNLQNSTVGTDSRIGANLTAAKGQAWRPSSNHPGIYSRLLTPAGQRYGEAVVDGTSY